MPAGPDGLNRTSAERGASPPANPQSAGSNHREFPAGRAPWPGERLGRGAAWTQRRVPPEPRARLATLNPPPSAAQNGMCLWNTEVIGAWRSLVARTVRVGEVPGSNPGAPIGRSPRYCGGFRHL
jgi:hypothetical protein